MVAWKASFEEEDRELADKEVDEVAMGMSDKGAKVGANHTLPSAPIALVKLLNNQWSTIIKIHLYLHGRAFVKTILIFTIVNNSMW